MKANIRLDEERGKPPRYRTSANGLGTEIVPGTRVYANLKFNFSSEYPPGDWLSLFKKFPGLEILNLSYSPDKSIWNYEGKIYEAIR